MPVFHCLHGEVLEISGWYYAASGVSIVGTDPGHPAFMSFWLWHVDHWPKLTIVVVWIWKASQSNVAVFISHPFAKHLLETCLTHNLIISCYYHSFFSTHILSFFSWFSVITNTHFRVFEYFPNTPAFLSIWIPKTDVSIEIWSI